MNSLGKRLRWVREKLSKTYREVQAQTDISISTLAGWETDEKFPGRRLIDLVHFYDKLWASKYPCIKPVFSSKGVDVITTDWLIFGSDVHLNLAQKKSEIFQEDFRERELEYLRRISILEDQVRKLQSEVSQCLQ